jgi:hypothetical protein
VNLFNSLIGVGEVALLPLDILKIKKQTAPETLEGRGSILKIIWDQKLGLYRGGLWTAARNAPGSFALVRPSAKHTLYQNERLQKLRVFLSLKLANVLYIQFSIIYIPIL